MAVGILRHNRACVRGNRPARDVLHVHGNAGKTPASIGTRDRCSHHEDSIQLGAVFIRLWHGRERD
jgi:hypothetical protein